MRLGATTFVAVALLASAGGAAWAWEDYEKGENAPTISVPAAPKSSSWLPILGVMGDVGVPDGAIASVVLRPFSWIRVAGGGGTNGISRGWRGGLTLLPFGAGPSATVEYGRYEEGNANTLARKVIGGSFDGSPLLERVGYDYTNFHLGLDFGSRRVVVYLHGGMSILHGKIRNVETAIRDGSGSSSSSTEITVHEDPSVRAVGTSVKLGLIVYLL